MAHFKRKGPKSTRSGCLLCKPHKRQGAKCTHTARETAKRTAAAEEIRSAGGRARRKQAPLSDDRCAR